MKQYKVGVFYQVFGTIEVEATDREDLARKLADHKEIEAMPLPYEADYVDGTFEIDPEYDIEELGEI